MSPGPFRLSVGQSAVIVFYMTLCITPFSYGLVMIQHMGRWAWAGVLPGILSGVVGLAAVAVLRRRLPRESVLDYGPRLLGRFPGYLYLFVLWVLFGAGAGTNLRVVVDMLHTTLTAGMSDWVPALVITLLASAGAFFGPEVIARCAQVLLFALLPGLVLILTLPWLNAVPGRLWPLGAVPWHVFWQSARVVSIVGSCRGFLPLLILAPVIEGRRLFARTLGALLAAGAAIAVAFALPVAVLGPDFATRFRFPLLNAAGTLGWSWLPVQRFGHLTVLLWEVATFITAATYLWLGAAVGGHLFGRGHWRPLLPGLGAITLFLAAPVLGPDFQKGLQTGWNWAVFVLGIVLPVALAALSLRVRCTAS